MADVFDYVIEPAVLCIFGYVLGRLMRGRQ